MQRKITVLGAGRMGSALTLAFLERGHTVTVWNRTASKCAPLAAKGARVASSVEDAVSGADIVVGNVSDYATTTTILHPSAVARALSGKVLVQLATGSPRQARELAAWAREHRIVYLDGAIMATPDFIGQAGCTLVYSGEPGLYEANKDTLAALGGNALYVGADIGHANAVDAALLIVLWGALLGTWQAAALCEAEGFPLEALGGALGGIMPVLDGTLKDSIHRIAQRRFAADETTMASVDICHASARLIHEMSQQHGLHLGLTTALDGLFQRARDAGHAQDDIAAVYPFVKDAGAPPR